jgi:hypothetical protein
LAGHLDDLGNLIKTMIVRMSRVIADQKAQMFCIASRFFAV